MKTLSTSAATASRTLMVLIYIPLKSNLSQDYTVGFFFKTFLLCIYLSVCMRITKYYYIIKIENFSHAVEKGALLSVMSVRCIAPSKSGFS